ncbi:Cu-binding protein [Trapelia coarctata]|nr:Cu-binding protein [Trapelia coarctata]
MSAPFFQATKLASIYTRLPFICQYAAARRRVFAIRNGLVAPRKRSVQTSSQLQNQRQQQIGVRSRTGLVGRDVRVGDGCGLGMESSGGSVRRRGYKTVQEMRSRYKFGPFSMVAVVVFLSTGIGMGFYFRSEKERLQRQRIAEASKGVGKPKVGGAFELVDQDGKVWSSEEMKGRFSLVYFGFSHCPDICPEELDKMAHMLDLVSTALPPTASSNPTLLPIFITCDPARDTPSVLKAYLKEFHPALIGLTGTWEQIKAVCKLYRVYFSTPQGVKPGMDYLVDHSIYFYLMDPEGDFIEAIGRTHSAEKAARIISEHMSDWKGRIKR